MTKHYTVVLRTPLLVLMGVVIVALKLLGLVGWGWVTTAIMLVVTPFVIIFLTLIFWRAGWVRFQIDGKEVGRE